MTRQALEADPIGGQLGDLAPASGEIGEECPVEARTGARERIVPPPALATNPDQPRTPEIGEMSRGPGLGDAQRRHQVSHADLVVMPEQVEDTQARPLREGQQHAGHVRQARR